MSAIDKHSNITITCVCTIHYWSTYKNKAIYKFERFKIFQITSDMFLHELMLTYTNIHLRSSYQCLTWEKEPQRINVAMRMNIYLAKEYVIIEKLYHSLYFTLMTWQMYFIRNEFNLSNEGDKIYLYWVDNE